MHCLCYMYITILGNGMQQAIRILLPSVQPKRYIVYKLAAAKLQHQFIWWIHYIASLTSDYSKNQVSFEMDKYNMYS